MPACQRWPVTPCPGASADWSLHAQVSALTGRSMPTCQRWLVTTCPGVSADRSLHAQASTLTCRLMYPGTRCVPGVRYKRPVIQSVMWCIISSCFIAVVFVSLRETLEVKRVANVSRTASNDCRLYATRLAVRPPALFAFLLLALVMDLCGIKAWMGRVLVVNNEA